MSTTAASILQVSGVHAVTSLPEKISELICDYAEETSPVQTDIDGGLQKQISNFFAGISGEKSGGISDLECGTNKYDLRLLFSQWMAARPAAKSITAILQAILVHDGISATHSDPRRSLILELDGCAPRNSWNYAYDLAHIKKSARGTDIA